MTSYDDFMWKLIHKMLCTNSTPKVGIGTSKNIDEYVVENILNEKYTNGHHLELLQTMFDEMLSNNSINDTNNSEDFKFTPSSLHSSMLDILTDFKFASSKSTSEGYALFSNFKGASNLVVIKTSKKKKDNDSILFEYFIGKMGVNRLRKFVPNFAYTLSIFKCNPLVFDKDRNINTHELCGQDSSDPRFYVVYEKIKGISLHEFANSVRTSEGAFKLISYIIQLALALAVAQREISYTHYDLHTDNIILRQLDSPQVIEYDIAGITYKIQTDAIPTIIDYGFSHFIIDGIPFGGKTIPELGIIPTLSPTGFDLYKMVMYIMNECFKNNTGVFNKVSWIMEYFQGDPFGIYNAYQNKNDVKLSNAFKRGWENFYNVTSKCKLYNDIPINFINWIYQRNRDMWNKLIKTTESMYNIPSNDLIQSYRAKIDVYKIFKTKETMKNQIDNCDILQKDYESYVINKYIIQEFEKILDGFADTLVNYSDIREKITTLKIQTEKNKDIYSKNDLFIFSKFQHELLSSQNEKQLEKLEKKIRYVNTILDIKRLSEPLQRIQSFIDIYNNYKIFIQYSKYSVTEYSSQKIIDDYHMRSNLILKSFQKIKSEYIFDSLRKKFSNINYNILYDNKPMHPLSWELSESFIDSLITIQYVVDDMRSFYPFTEDVCVNIEKFVYDLAFTLATKRSTGLYVPSRSRIQICILALCARDELEYILNRNIVFTEIELTKFIDSIITLSLKDDQIFKQLKKLSVKYHNVSPEKELEIVTRNNIYTSLKSNENLSLLDLGSNGITNEFIDVMSVHHRNFSKVDITNFVGVFPFSSDHFSLITGIMVFHNCTDISSVVLEIYRVLRVGGLFIVKEYDSGTQTQKLMCDIDIRLNGKENDNKSLYLSTDELKNIIHKVGFKSVDETNFSTIEKYLLFTK